MITHARRSFFVAALAGAGLLIPSLAITSRSFADPVASASVGKSAGKIGYVDVERCFGETEDGLRAKALLRKITDSKQSQLGSIEEKLKTEQEAVQQLQQTVGPGPKLTAAALTFQRHYTEYQQRLRSVNLELSRREDELFAPIEKKVKTIFERIGAEDGFDLIIDKKSMPSAKTGLDLTDRVIREYNWGIPVVASASAVVAPVVAPIPTASASAAPSAKP
ncbi:MAG: OmpH family outer membrane protein [Polyangiales bacterium]